MTPLVPPPLVLRIAHAIRDAGGRALLVGGCVRDHLMGLPIKDWDLEVYGLDADDLERALRPLGRLDTVGRAFSVFKLSKRGLELDISLPRRDSKQGPGHRGILAEGDPTMTPTEAARRRDLTVNAILVDPLSGEVVDPWGGQQDLARGVLRAVDDATFLEDPLRALRAVQFLARFGFEVDPGLERLCREAALDELPPERVLGEWTKLLLRGRALADALDLARRTAVLARVLPEVDAHTDAGTDAALDRARALRDALPDEPRQLTLMLAVWLHPLPTAAVEATLDRLRLHRWHGYPVRDVTLAAHAHQTDPVDTDAALRWLSTHVEVDLALRAREAVRDDPSLADRRARAAALGVLHEAPAPWVQGRDLFGLGVRPGPAMGRLVQRCYTAQLDGAVQDRDQALALAAAWAAER